MAHLAAVAAQVKNVHAHHAHAHAEKHDADDSFDSMLAAAAPQDDPAKDKTDAVAPSDAKVVPHPVAAARTDTKPQPKVQVQDKTKAPSQSVSAVASEDDGDAPVAPVRPVQDASRQIAAQKDVPADKEKVSHAPVPQAKLPSSAVAAVVAAAKSALVEEVPAAQVADTGKPALNVAPSKATKSDARLNAAKVSGSVLVLDKSAPDDKAPSKPDPLSVRDQIEQPQSDPAKPDRIEPDQPKPVSVEPVAKTAQPVQSATQITNAAAIQTASATEQKIVKLAVAERAAAAEPDMKALAVQIAAKAAQGTKSFEIRLDPAELGRVDVHLSVSRDGKAEATLYADRPETVALLQRDSQNLERALKDAGLDVSNSSLNFSLKQGERQGDGGGASRAHTRNLSDAVVARSEAVNASLANQTYTPGNGRLDIRV